MFFSVKNWYITMPKYSKVNFFLRYFYANERLLLLSCHTSMLLPYPLKHPPANISSTNRRDNVSETFKLQIFETISTIRKNSKHPDSKAIQEYIINNSASNINESFVRGSKYFS